MQHNVAGHDSIVATGVYSARELLRVTRSKCLTPTALIYLS